jgi:hypothetical protein
LTANARWIGMTRTRSDSLRETNTNRAACSKIRAARFLLTPAARESKAFVRCTLGWGDLQGAQECHELLLLLSR